MRTIEELNGLLMTEWPSEEFSWKIRIEDTEIDLSQAAPLLPTDTGLMSWLTFGAIRNLQRVRARATGLKEQQNVVGFGESFRPSLTNPLVSSGDVRRYVAENAKVAPTAPLGIFNPVDRVFVPVMVEAWAHAMLVFWMPQNIAGQIQQRYGLSVIERLQSVTFAA